MRNIIFLGTSSMVPTKDRAPSAVLLRYNGVGILFDCGEGAQRQMNLAGINRNVVDVICISHWHADHVAGLVGLLQTLSNKEGGHSLTIIGPVETKKRVAMLLDATYFDSKLSLDIREFDGQQLQKCYETDAFTIMCASLEHSTPVLGFRFVEKDVRRIDVAKKAKLGLTDGPHLQQLQAGKDVVVDGRTFSAEDVTYVKQGAVVTYVTDTLPVAHAIDLAQDADIFICESTFGDDLTEKAEDYKHMTALQAARIAVEANVKMLYLTHFSQRYVSVDHLRDEAKVLFDRVECAHDFLSINF